jgi:ribosomal protein S18 acetylase RimI-like enzyme
MITIDPVLTLEDAQIFRTIRNDCRLFMTRNTDYITEEQQVTWYNNLDKSKYKLFLFYEIYHGAVVVPVGFGIIREEDDVLLLTGGVSSTDRGKGIGRFIFERLLDIAKTENKKIKLEVLISNTIAHSLYCKLGFKETNRNDRVIMMEYDI